MIPLALTRPAYQHPTLGAVIYVTLIAVLVGLAVFATRRGR
ncbi:hypothetical protein [Catenulispora pinistramenti]|nr:hypothetical protein [Catenulispora pinistramenti]